ncbi:MAG: hypothetical protein IJW38_04210 [Clostridia bacterium]|nr:hypothetical protein [Clostridia bacterium]
MKRGFCELILKFTAVCLSVVPVSLATISYFPIWKKEGAVSMLSGFTLLLLLFSIIPLIKLFKKYFTSPTATNMWFIFFLVFFALSKIADEMVVISLVGYLGNLLASLIWKLSGRVRGER